MVRESRRSRHLSLDTRTRECPGEEKRPPERGDRDKQSPSKRDERVWHPGTPEADGTASPGQGSGGLRRGRCWGSWGEQLPAEGHESLTPGRRGEDGRERI